VLLLLLLRVRCQVVRCVRELPYSEADVELYEDCEHLEGLNATATAAVLQVTQGRADRHTSLVVMTNCASASVQQPGLP
jgi:hypothetical protein